MNNIIKPAVILILVVFSSVFSVSYVWKITYPYIAKQEIDQLNKAFELVLPGYTISDEITAVIDGHEKFTYRIGIKTVDGVEKKGYAFISVNHGYCSEIKTIAAVDEENRIIGISIIQQAETPGLSAGFTESTGKETIWGIITGKSFEGETVTGPLLQEQFRGIDLNKKIRILKKGLRTMESSDELLSQNAITAVTGATVTTRVITDGLADGLVKLKKARLMLEQIVIPEQKKEVAE